MSGSSLVIVLAAGLSVTAMVALVLGPSSGPAGRRRGRSDGDTATDGDAAVDHGAAADAGSEDHGSGLGWGARMARSVAVRRGLVGLTVVLLVAAGISLSWPFWTDQYQTRLQVRLEQQLEEQIEDPAAAEAFVAGEVRSGDSLTRLRAPSIGVDVVVVEGTTQEALRAGAGHYPETALPCGAGNVAIAGHRTTFGKPFHRLDEVPVGAEITLETPVGTCRYRVDEPAFVVTPDQVEVVAPTDHGQLTLTTCHPKGSARERLVLQAVLVGEPLHDDQGGRTPPDIRGET